MTYKSLKLFIQKNLLDLLALSQRQTPEPFCVWKCNISGCFLGKTVLAQVKTGLKWHPSVAFLS